MPWQGLNMSPDYMLNVWDLVDCFREYVTNFMDEELRTGIKGTVKYEPENKRLILENPGSFIERKNMALGQTDKRDDARMIGQYGEGGKTAIPGLLRAGIGIVIRNGSEVWKPGVRFSKALQCEEVGIDITEGNQDKQRVRVEFTGITPEDWEDLQNMFLRLQKKKVDMVSTRRGDILLDERLMGCLFVKGVRIQKDVRLRYGYNFNDEAGIKMGRDRKSFEDTFNLEWAMKEMWAEGVQIRPDIFSRFKLMLEGKAQDLNGISAYSASSFGANIIDKLEQEFKAQYGEKAIPVPNDSESRKLEEHSTGKVGVVNDRLHSLLSKRFKPVAEIVEEHLNAAVKEWGWHELTGERGRLDTEKGKLYQVEWMIQLVMPAFNLSCLNIVDFNEKSPGLLGTWDGDTKKILVGRKVLEDLAETLATVCHEVGHIDGSRDGEREHAFNVESLLSRIAVKVLELQMAEGRAC